jgi:F-type H+-transporting ATPase subunit a
VTSSGIVVAAVATEGNGFPAPNQGIFSFQPMFHIGGFAVTKPMFMAFLGAAVVIAFMWAAFARPRVVPGRMQAVGEMGYLFVRDEIARSVIGKKGDKYVPFLVSLFFFVWILNLFSIIPLAQFPVTSRIAYPAILSAIVYVVFVFLGMKNQHGLGYFKNVGFPPGVPKALYLLLTPIELISTFLVRPFTLAVRLFANMFAGHLLIVTFSIAAWFYIVENPGILSLVGVAGFAMTVVMTAFELLIQALQAFIFTLLAAVYIGGALEAEH